MSKIRFHLDFLLIIIGAGLCSAAFNCSEEGIFPDPDHCNKYYNCFHIDAPATSASCLRGSVFNPATSMCDKPINVPQCEHFYGDEDDVAAPGVLGGCLRRVCYYTNWAQYRPGWASFKPYHIDVNLCSHLVFAFAQLHNDLLAPYEWNDEDTEWSKGMYSQFNELKKDHPHVKTLLAVGGWNMASDPFSRMVATEGKRLAFAKHAVKFLRDRNFDGLDLDWEFPTARGSPPGDRARFTDLVQILRKTFNSDGVATKKPPLLLTAAVAAEKHIVNTAYDIPKICKDFDYISVMAYDFHGGSWEDETGHHSGLYAHSSDTGDRAFLNGDYAMNYWADGGCPRDKLVMGIPTYSRNFLLTKTATGVRAPATTTPGGEMTQTGGFRAYYEICMFEQNKHYVHWLSDQQVPYIVKDRVWEGYDNAKSAAIKVQYMVDNNFGGMMMWTLDLDDFANVCGLGAYPIWSAVNRKCSSVDLYAEKSTGDGAQLLPTSFVELLPMLAAVLLV